MGVGVRGWGRGFDDHENRNFLINIITMWFCNTAIDQYFKKFAKLRSVFCDIHVHVHVTYRTKKNPTLDKN
jgi:hypothetical protein